MTNPFKEFRADGWPLCPHCGKDELGSYLIWTGEGDKPSIQSYINAGMYCYYCRLVFIPMPITADEWNEYIKGQVK